MGVLAGLHTGRSADTRSQAPPAEDLLPRRQADVLLILTHQELEADRSRRTILAERVALIEAKDAEERVRQMAKLDAERQVPAQQRMAASASSSSSTQQTISQPPAAAASSRQARSPAPPAPAQTPSRPDLEPTPPADPLRAASQRALREQVVNSGSSRAERQGKTAEGLPKRLGGEEWKPQGWSGKVGVQRGD